MSVRNLHDRDAMCVYAANHRSGIPRSKSGALAAGSPRFGGLRMEIDEP